MNNIMEARIKEIRLEQINCLENKLKKAVNLLHKKERELNHRNSLFGDYTQKPQDMFPDTFTPNAYAEAIRPYKTAVERLKMDILEIKSKIDRDLLEAQKQMQI